MTGHPPLHDLAAYWLDSAPTIRTAGDAVDALDDAMTRVLAGVPHEIWTGKPRLVPGDDGVMRPIQYQRISLSGPMTRAAFMIAQFVTGLRMFGEYNGRLIIEGGSMSVQVSSNPPPMADTFTVRANVSGLPAEVSVDANA